MLTGQSTNLKKLVIVYKLFPVVQYEMQAWNLFVISKHDVCHVKAGNLTLFLTSAEVVCGEGGKLVTRLAFSVFYQTEFDSIALIIETFGNC